MKPVNTDLFMSMFATYNTCSPAHALLMTVNIRTVYPQLINAVEGRFAGTLTGFSSTCDVIDNPY